MSKIVQVRLRWAYAITPLTGVRATRLINYEVSDEEAKLMLERDKSRFFKEVSGPAKVSLIDNPPAQQEEKPVQEGIPAQEEKPVEEPTKDAATAEVQPPADAPKKRGRKKKIEPA